MTDEDFEKLREWIANFARNALDDAKERIEELERELAVARQRCAALELLAKDSAP